MSDYEEDSEDLPPIRELVVDSEVFNLLATTLSEMMEEGADSVELCIHEMKLNSGKRCQITVKAEASDELGEFESELAPSSVYSCIYTKH